MHGRPTALAGCLPLGSSAGQMSGLFIKLLGSVRTTPAIRASDADRSAAPVKAKTGRCSNLFELSRFEAFDGLLDSGLYSI
jgi:hypothetical protein